MPRLPLGEVGRSSSLHALVAHKHSFHSTTCTGHTLILGRLTCWVLQLDSCLMALKEEAHLTERVCHEEAHGAIGHDRLQHMLLGLLPPTACEVEGLHCSRGQGSLWLHQALLVYSLNKLSHAALPWLSAKEG